MKISIIGCGNAGSAVAADLALKGNNVTLLKASDSNLHSSHFEKIYNDNKILLEDDNGIRVANVSVTKEFDKAIIDQELIIIFVQTNYHDEIIKKISQYLEDGQIILIEPGYLSTCYFLKYCNKNITIVEAESSPIDCRIVKPGQVKVLFRNVRNPLGVFPSKNETVAKNVLDKLGYNFVYTNSVVSAALHNPNLIVHTVGAIMSVPRIERCKEINTEYSMYREVFTSSVWNLVLALDSEKMNVLEKFNCKRVSYVDACKFRNSIDLSVDSTKVFFDYANNSAPTGPTVSNSRYITEDIPQGLVMLESLGKRVNVGTPVCSALIDISSNLLKIDFRKEGRTLQKLGDNNLTILVDDAKLKN